jgi:hypothetical protein
VSSDATSIELQPDGPLAPGAYALVVASRLKDAEGRRLVGTGARFAFAVADEGLDGPLPVLDAPLADSAAPRNLRRVRVSFPQGAPHGAVSLVAQGGGVAAGPAVSDGGPMVLELERLEAVDHALAVDGREVPGASFHVAACDRTRAPALVGALDVRAGDTWAEVPLELDGPALATVQAVPVIDGKPCDQPAAASALLVECAPDPCGGDAGPPKPACAAVARLQGLQPASSYALRVQLEDDEGDPATAVEAPFQTLGGVPKAVISEVMASPPPPAPRSDGEYIEILNAGDALLDLSLLALAGPDDKPRPVAAAASQGPTRLAPGERALAVGLDFDPRRYPLPAGLALARADTQKLLGRGLADVPPAIRLLYRPPSPAGSAADAGTSLEIDRFPGASKACAEGHPFERYEVADGGAPEFRCGADGGSPGRAPAG